MLLRYFGSATVFFCHVGVWLTLFLRPKGEKVRYEKIFLPDVLFGGGRCSIIADRCGYFRCVPELVEAGGSDCEDEYRK